MTFRPKTASKLASAALNSAKVPRVNAMLSISASLALIEHPMAVSTKKPLIAALH